MLHNLLGLPAGLRFSKCSELVSCTALKPSGSVLGIRLKQLVRQSLFKMMIFRQSINKAVFNSTMNHIQRIFMISRVMGFFR